MLAPACWQPGSGRESAQAAHLTTAAIIISIRARWAPTGEPGRAEWRSREERSDGRPGREWRRRGATESSQPPDLSTRTPPLDQRERCRGARRGRRRAAGLPILVACDRQLCIRRRLEREPPPAGRVAPVSDTERAFSQNCVPRINFARRARAGGPRPPARSSGPRRNETMTTPRTRRRNNKMMRGQQFER
jgi:hypothetical protein